MSISEVLGVKVYRTFQATELSKRINSVINHSGIGLEFPNKHFGKSELINFPNDYTNLHINWSTSKRLFSPAIRAITARLENDGQILISQKPFYMRMSRAHKKVEQFLLKTENRLKELTMLQTEVRQKPEMIKEAETMAIA